MCLPLPGRHGSGRLLGVIERVGVAALPFGGVAESVLDFSLAKAVAADTA